MCFMKKLLILSFLLLPLSSQSKTVKKLIQYGVSASGRPLIANIFYDSSVLQHGLIFISEGMHGNEYLGLVSGITKNLLQDNSVFEAYIKAGGVVMTIPQINPDGVHFKSRFNIIGKDLNRDFHDKKKSEHRETRSLKLFLDKFLVHHSLKFQFAMDYHCCATALLHPNEDSVNKDLYMSIANISSKYLGKTYIMSSTKKVFGKFYKGTLKDYLFNKYRVPTMTYEAPDLGEDKKLTKHLNFWKKTASVVERYSTKKRAFTQTYRLSKSSFFNSYKPNTDSQLSE